MWRYLAGGVAAVLMVAAGWLLFNGQAHSDTLATPQPLAAADVQGGGEGAADDPTSALPAADRSREQKRFDRYDKDRDDRITRDEYLAPRHKAFAKLDTNGDGRLSFEEWAAKTTGKFAAADRDRSATLSRDEFATTAPKRRAARPACRCPEPAATPADD